ncbi:MAG: RNA-binding S4 domain-containing protein [Clostridia bacterium]|jgi:ribosomal 50S subunit-recycling heat shock protein|nr:RNA-binding S4 domain-containing protein [Clostridia bacterium]
MRLDKFLKVSRLIKRRTVAKEVCDGGKVKINGTTAKAGSVVKVGDVIEITFGEKVIKAKILEVADNVPAAKAREMYELLSE